MEFNVEIPPKDQVFVIYEPEATDVDTIKKAIEDSGYGVKNIKEMA